MACASMVRSTSRREERLGQVLGDTVSCHTVAWLTCRRPHRDPGTSAPLRVGQRQGARPHGFALQGLPRRLLDHLAVRGRTAQGRRPCGASADPDRRSAADHGTTCGGCRPAGSQQEVAKVRISIAFNPITEEFATTTPPIRRNPEWISDISDFFNSESTYTFIREYFEGNPDVDQRLVETNLARLEGIKNALIGIISLGDDLDVETVSEIFIRINSKGVPLSSADFAMSKIATYGDRGRNLRKLIDYFCHLAVAPHVYADIKDNDHEFAASPYLAQISWLKRRRGGPLRPRATATSSASPGLSGSAGARRPVIVSELSGRDPDTRKVDEDRIPVAYDKLEGALLQIVSNTTSTTS